MNNQHDNSYVYVHVTREGEDKITMKAVMCVLGAWAILLIIGGQLSWGNMSTYIASYYYLTDKSVTMEQFSLVQPIIVVTATFTFPIGMYLSNLYNEKL